MTHQKRPGKIQINKTFKIIIFKGDLCLRGHNIGEGNLLFLSLNSNDIIGDIIFYMSHEAASCGVIYHQYYF
jgi:hypothetical protein